MGLDGHWNELSGWSTSYMEQMVPGSWGSTVEARGLVFLDLIKADQFGSRQAEMSWNLEHHKMRRV